MVCKRRDRKGDVKASVRIEIPIKIERNQLVRKIGKLSKYDTYVYINELMDFMNNDINEKFHSIK